MNDFFDELIEDSDSSSVETAAVSRNEDSKSWLDLMTSNELTSKQAESYTDFIKERGFTIDGEEGFVIDKDTLKRALANKNNERFFKVNDKEVVSEVAVDENGSTGFMNKTQYRNEVMEAWWRGDQGTLSSIEKEFLRTMVNKERARAETVRNILSPAGPMYSTRVRDDVTLRTKAFLNELELKNEYGDKRIRLHRKDYDVIYFLAMFKYATAKQLRHIHGISLAGANRRMRKLEDAGIVYKVNVLGPQPVWFLSRLGMDLSGFDYGLFTPDKVSHALFAHQFAVNYVAANIIGGGLDVLNLGEGLVPFNRMDEYGIKLKGDYVVSEQMIRAELSRAVYMAGEGVGALLRQERLNAFEQWFKGGMSVPSPEFTPGNEWMWVLFPKTTNKSWHVPDLVVSRQRGSNHAPESIAVEVELNKKNSARTTLKAYGEDNFIFKKVVWVCSKPIIANTVAQEAEALGLLSNGKVEVTLLSTEDGPFVGRNMWDLG